MKVLDILRRTTDTYFPTKVSLDSSKTHQNKCDWNTGWHFSIQYRYVAATYGFLLTSMLNAHRINIGVAILEMGGSNSSVSNRTNVQECPSSIHGVESVHNETEASGEFNWNAEVQGYILAAGHVGYMIPQLPAGRIAEIYGSKSVLLSALLCTSLVSLLSPLFARLGAVYFLVVQLIKGIGLGMITPALSRFMSNWFPGQERRFLLSFVYSGFSVGAFIGGTLSGFFCELSLFGGWPLVFYFFGMLGCILFLYLMLFLYETPEEHPYIKESEVKYILEQRKRSSSPEALKVPWRELLFSAPSLALFYGSFGQFWLAFFFINVEGSYLGNILNFPIAENGIISSVPFLLRGVVTCCASYLSDVLHRKKNMSLDRIRKTNNTISCAGFGFCLVGVYFAGCDKISNLSFFILAIALSGFGYPGAITASVDMSPNFAGTLTGITSSMAGISGFVVPVVAGYFTRDEQSLYQWRKVFLTSIFVVFTSGIIFELFGSADVQPWNESDDTKTKKAETEEETQDDLETITRPSRYYKQNKYSLIATSNPSES